MKRIAVFISGTGSNMKRIVEETEIGGIRDAKVILVLSSTSEAGGLKYAAEKGIATEVFSYKNKSESEICEGLKSLMELYKIDLIALAGFIKILPPDFADLYKKRIVNIHPSLIPMFCGKGYYGIKVHEEVIRSGAKESGATVHYVDSGVDTGDIIMQESCPVLEGDSPETLQKRVLEIEHVIFSKAIDRVLNT